jgi:hypothetical protein
MTEVILFSSEQMSKNTIWEIWAGALRLIFCMSDMKT